MNHKLDGLKQDGVDGVVLVDVLLDVGIVEDELKHLRGHCRKSVSLPKIKSSAYYSRAYTMKPEIQGK